MQKNTLFYIVAFGLLILSLIFFSNAYREVLRYSNLTDRTNGVHNSFQNLSKDINNAAVLNPDLIKGGKNDGSLKLFFTDSQTVLRHLELLTLVVKDSVNIKIAENVRQLIRTELHWIIESNVPDSIVHHNSWQHITTLENIDSLLKAGIKRSDFLLEYNKAKLNKAITSVQLWVIVFIGLSAGLIFYFSFDLYRHKSRIKSIEDEMSTVFNRISDGIISIDHEFRYTFANETSVKINGKEKSKLIGHPLIEVHPEIRDTIFWRQLHAAKQTGQAAEFDAFNASSNRWYSVKIYPSPDGFTIYYVDITERKKATERESLFVSIVNSSEDAIVSKTLDSIVSSWNKGAENIFGFSEKEMVGSPISMIVPEDLLNEEAELMAKIIRGESIEHYETERLRKDGQRINISLSVSPVFDINGNISGASKIARDITEAKKAVLAILTANNEKNTILESIDDAFFAVDENWTVNYWNSHAEQELGVAKKDIIGRHLWQVFAGSIDSISYNKYHEAVNTHQAIRFEDYYAVLQKWYDINAYPSSNGLSVYFKDITERKSAEIRLNELNQHLAHQARELASSNEELEQFAYVASHDLQEPLRTVTSFLTKLEKKYAGLIDEKGKIYIDFAVEAAKRMRQIILDLLEFSRVGKAEVKREYVDINELIREINLLFIKQIEDKKATIATFKLPVIHTYKIALYQVFQNLISNALKYTAPGRPCKIEVRATDLNTYWQFTVADNGIGIDEQFFEKIFFLFQRLHNNDDYSGTGMGLAVSKKALDSLGGKIWLTSTKGQGSTFYFTIAK